MLFVFADYQLDNDANKLTVTMNAMLLPHNDALRALHAPRGSYKVSAENAIYRNALIFQTRMPGAGEDRDANIAAWSANGGAAARAALSLASKKLAAMLASDMPRGEKDGDPAGAVPRKINNVAGMLIDHDADGELVRFQDGTLIYLTNAVL